MANESNINKIPDIALKWQKLPDSFLSGLSQMVSNSNKTIIDLSIGDSYIGTHLDIIKEAFNKTTSGYTGYTDPDSLTEFVFEIQNYYKNKLNLSLNINQIRATVGAMHGMYMALRAIINCGDEVVIFEPYYPPYEQQVYMCDGVPIFFDALHHKNSLDFLNQLENLISSKTKIIVINSPNNPSGCVYSDEILRGVAELAKKYSLFIFSDEVYEMFNYTDRHSSIYSYAPNNTIIFGSFSKSFRMAGWRIGYMIAPKAINDVVRVISDSLTYTAPTISQYAAIFALKNQDISSMYAILMKKKLDYIYRRIRNINNLSMEKVQGGIFAFVCIKNTGLMADEFSEKLFNKYQVLVAPGTLFSKTFGKYYIRISATQKFEALREALNRLESFITELRLITSE